VSDFNNDGRLDVANCNQSDMSIMHIEKGLKMLIDNQVVILADTAVTPSVRSRVEALRAWLRNKLLILKKEASCDGI
jgi:hypothetical protein